LAFVLTPLGLLLAGVSLTSVFGVSALAVLILIAHRRNIADEMHSLMMDRKVKRDKRTAHK
jgi:hypothetical protein